MLRVKNVVFKGQVFVVSIDLLAIETCILVEIDLQVLFFLVKLDLLGQKYTFFHILPYAGWDA